MIASRTSSGCRSSFIFSTLFSFCSLRLRTPYLSSDEVQPALGRLHPSPTPRPRVLPWRDGPRLGLATDARVAHAEQGVERYAVLPDVSLDLPGAPAGERRYLRHPEALLPAHDRRVRPVR